MTARSKTKFLRCNNSIVLYCFHAFWRYEKVTSFTRLYVVNSDVVIVILLFLECTTKRVIQAENHHAFLTFKRPHSSPTSPCLLLPCSNSLLSDFAQGGNMLVTWLKIVVRKNTSRISINKAFFSSIWPFDNWNLSFSDSSITIMALTFKDWFYFICLLNFFPLALIW